MSLRQKMRSRHILLLALLLLCTVLACGQRSGEQGSQQGEEEGYLVYYINKDETAVVTESYEPEGETTSQLLGEFVRLLKEQPDNAEWRAAIPQSVTVQSYSLDKGQLALYFDSAYLEMNKLYEILCRSAIVRTLCQIPEVENVSFFVADNPLMDSNGTPVGPLSQESFIENMGNEINTYTVATLTLYFANEAGDKLVEEMVDVRYSSNMSIEKLVVEQLIRGPITDDAYPAIPPETKLVSVSTRDGVCYVNLDEGFLGQGYDVLEAIPIYSIVNSLTDIPGVSRVQILINGETNRTFRESLRFETIYERNLDLIE